MGGRANKGGAVRERGIVERTEAAEIRAANSAAAAIIPQGSLNEHLNSTMRQAIRGAYDKGAGRLRPIGGDMVATEAELAAPYNGYRVRGRGPVLPIRTLGDMPYDIRQFGNRFRNKLTLARAAESDDQHNIRTSRATVDFANKETDWMKLLAAGLAAEDENYHQNAAVLFNAAALRFKHAPGRGR